MVRDENTVPGRNSVSDLPLASATRLAPTQPSTNYNPPLALFDPFSQQMIVHAKAGGATQVPDPSTPAPRREAAGGVPKAVRLLQVVLLSSVALMIVYMISLLQMTK